MVDGFGATDLFGLGTYGAICRALLRDLYHGDVDRFAHKDGHFSNAVFPGHRLDTLIWRDAGGARFRGAAA